MPMVPGAYPIQVDVDPPESQSRLTVFFRFLFVIPAIIFMAVIGIVAEIFVVLAWLAIVVTGSLPSGLGNFLAGTLKASTRISGYTYLLTGSYPPFSLGDAAYPVRAQVNVQYSGRSRVTVFFRIFMIIPHA